MKSFDTDLKKYAEKVSLKASERRELRERVLSYMEYHPLPKQADVFVPKRLDGILSEPTIPFSFNFRSKYTRIAAGVFAIVVIVTPFVAERSVPGDTLYLVKTNLNESIQGTLVTTPYEKIEFETKLMERRIAEARVLADEGKLTEEVKTKIADTVKEHADAVQDGIAELRTSDADGAAIAGIGFNASLEVQSVVLGGDESTDNASLIDTILIVVNEARQEVATNQGDEKPSYESLIAHVESETTRAYELFETVKESATKDEISDIERRLSDIDRLILEAKEKQPADALVATNDLATALGLTQKLIAFMTDIDIREAVSLESIVPVVLSDEERIVRAQEGYARIEVARAQFSEQVTIITEENVKEKVSEGIIRLEDLSMSVAHDVKTGDMKSAENKVKEADQLIADLMILTEGYPMPETPVIEDVELLNPEEVDEEVVDDLASTTPEISEEFPTGDSE